MHQMLKYLLNITKSIPQSDEYPSDYFAVNITIMKTATLWYPNKNNLNEWQPNRAYIAFSIFALLFCVGFCTPSEFISFWDTQTDINAFTMNVGVALTHLVASIKVTNWFVRRRTLLALMAVLDGETYRYEIYREFIPGYIILKAKHTNINVSTVFFWCSIMVPLSGYIVGFITLAFNNESFYITDKTNGTSIFYCSCLPFYSWIPFDHSTEATCVIAMLFQLFPMMYLTLMIVGVDTLFMSLVNYLTAHIRVLQGAFRTFRQRAEEKLIKLYGYQNLDTEMLNKFTMIEMKKCLKHLQTIQRLGKTIEDVYSLQMLCQVLVSLFVLCTCLYLVSTEPMTSKTFLVEVIYIIAIEYQLTLYCWFGNELTLASESIGDALYESDWLITNGAIKRCIIITMIRIKRPLYVTVGKFTPLTLTTLQAIVRLSYSMYAVLKNGDSN